MTETGSRPQGFGFVIPMTALLCVQGLLSLSVLVVPVIAPIAGAELGVEARSIGVFTGVMFSASMICSLWSGAVIGRFGAVGAVQFCLALGAVGIAMIALSGVAALFVGGLLLGIAYGPNSAASSEILARYTPDRFRNIAFSLKQSGMPLGSVLAGGVVIVLVEPFGWRASLVGIGAVCIVAMVLMQGMKRNWDSGRAAQGPARALRSPLTPLRAVLSERRTRRMCIASLSFIYIQFALSTFLVAYLYQEIGLSSAQAAGIYAAAHMAGVVARPGLGVIADGLIPPVKLLGIAGLLMCGGCIALALFTKDTPVAAFYAVALLIGSTASGWNGVGMAEVSRAIPADQVGYIMGGYLFVCFTAVVTGPLVFSGILALGGSYQLAYGLFAIGAGVTGLTQLLQRN
ncbi:MAG: MFS transporter [Alphaproteobacteria bacterium]